MNRFKSLPRVVQIAVVIAVVLIACCCSATGLSLLFPGDDDATPTQAAIRLSPTQVSTGTPLLPTETQELPTDIPQPTITAQPTAAQVPTNTPVPTPERTEASVIRVIDGDTIEVAIDDRTFTVRYIGVDTPETVHPEKPVEWMGPEASAVNKELVEGKTVYLEKDVSETDKYDRLLRYIFLADGTFVNA